MSEPQPAIRAGALSPVRRGGPALGALGAPDRGQRAGLVGEAAVTP